MAEVTTILREKDLSPEQRRAAELLLGRAVEAGETVMVRASRIVKDAPNEEERREAIDKLKQYFSRIDAKPKDLSPEEEDELIDETMRSVRPGYQPPR
jgi:hypothetical protein